MTIDQQTQIIDDVDRLLRELIEKGNIRAGQWIVFGVSTSEVVGKRIGTSGALEVAEAIYKGVEKARSFVSFTPLFQCCEHLNRAIVAPRSILEDDRLTEVTAVPVPEAGGAMAAYAYRQLEEPCLIESVQAHAGVDIGDTLIGMHLRPVAVPFRSSVTSIGQAHVTAAFTRPRLIGGARAVYRLDP